MAEPTDDAGFESSRVDATESWQPFSKNSPWNLKLPGAGGSGGRRTEVALPSPALAVAPVAASDGEYGIKIYFAHADDPTWSVAFDDFNSATDEWNPPRPLKLRAPQVLRPPSGTDGTVIVVDEQRAFAYEMWRFTALPAKAATDDPAAHATSINVVDLRGSGVHRNVGVTAAGLPGVGGVLRSVELAGSQPIRHKLWLAVHPSLLFAAAVWPASTVDTAHDGVNAVLRYGDVVALGQDFDVASSECRLSPLIQRVAQALKDYGGIVQDQGGDSLGIVCEVGAVQRRLDVDTSSMWAQFACLKRHLVRVSDPWNGAIPGGLGY